jgi:hypothetical protein
MSKKNKTTWPQAMDFILLGKDMMGRSEKRMGTMASEERRFRELFGVSPEVALVMWNLLLEYRLVPFKGTMTHFLWTLCFLKVYAKLQPMCALCGGIDPKTLKKWVWAFIDALASLEGYVVSGSKHLLQAFAFENRRVH